MFEFRLLPILVRKFSEARRSLHEGKNFLLSMLKLGSEKSLLNVVGDQFGAPTSSIQLADATLRVLRQVGIRKDQEFPSGVFHLTAAGRTSWCGFALGIFEKAAALFGKNFAQVREITSSEYPTPAKRPLNSVLDNTKFERTFGFRLEPWEKALDLVIGELKVQQTAAGC